MILEKINFKDLKRIIDKKLFIFLIAISITTIFISLLEIVGIGILASFVLFLSDIRSFTSNLPDFYIFNYFKELNQKELINIFLLIIIIFFIIKNCSIFVFIFFFNKFKILFNYSISKKLLNKYLSENYEFYLANKNSNFSDFERAVIFWCGHFRKNPCRVPSISVSCKRICLWIGKS